MKKKKKHVLFDVNKKKAAQRAVKHKEKYYDDSYEDEEYGGEEYYEEEYYEEEYYEEPLEEYYESEEYAEEDGYYEGETSEEYYEEGYYEDEPSEAYDEEETYAEDDGCCEEEYYGDEPTSYEGEPSEEYYEEEEYEEEEQDEDAFDIGYGSGNDVYDDNIYEAYEQEYDSYEDEDDDDWYPVTFLERVKEVLQNMTALDGIVAVMGVAILAAAFLTFGTLYASNKMEEQIQAIVPIGTELSQVGIIGEYGLTSVAEAMIAGPQSAEEETQEAVTSEVVEVKEEQAQVRVSVNFTSIERDLKIRFTDSSTGALITGEVFEVTLTNAKGKQLHLTDDDRDGVIYATNVNAGRFDAIIASTDKYKFPTTPQQVTVKDKIEYVVVNVQDEVKTESQVNVSAEDTEEKVAAKEEVKLTDTVEWVESAKAVVGGTEGYTKIDKNTIPDPSQLSLGRARMMFDTLNVTLDNTSLKLFAGTTAALKGSEFSDYEESTEGSRKEYKFTTQWKSSNEGVASVAGGTVTAKAAGTSTITYTVTRKTITTKTIPGESKEETKTETVTISVEEYEKLSEEEQAKCTPVKDEADETVIKEYKYEKTTTTTTQGESKTEVTENTEDFSAKCEVTVEAVQITSGNLTLTKTADACSVRGTLTVKPSKLEYTMNDGSRQTITENFPAVFYSSSDTSIASVDSGTGVVTGVKQGTATITGQIKGVKDAAGKELDIKATTTVTVNPAAELSIKLDREQVWLGVKGQTTLVATVAGHVSDNGVTWSTADKNIATVDEKGVVTGVKPGTVKITATTKEKNAKGKQLAAVCTVTINSSATEDTTTRLKDKDGRQVYIKNGEGKYVEAVHADYYKASEFFIMNVVQYAYVGWQTIDGRTYYYDKNGKPVTGTQIIQGVTYNFGSDGAIQTTVNGSTFGIDVSKHNGKIDWNAVRSSGVDYVIIRCAYRGSATGALITDPTFHTNIKGAQAAGLKVGIYVFSQAVNEVEAVKEASLAVSLAQGYRLTYPIFIDTEASGGRADKIDTATRTAVVNAFCQTVQNAGYKAGIYASKAWYEEKLNMGALGGYKIWLAQYAAAPSYKGRFDMWQYSCKGTISGINGKVDLNLSYLGY